MSQSLGSFRDWCVQLLLFWQSLKRNPADILGILGCTLAACAVSYPCRKFAHCGLGKTGLSKTNVSLTHQMNHVFRGAGASHYQSARPGRPGFCGGSNLGLENKQLPYKDRIQSFLDLRAKPTQRIINCSSCCQRHQDLLLA